MGSRIDGDIVVLPAGGWPFIVMLLQRLVVIGAVIAEQLAECIQPARLACHQPVPEIMPALMAEMPQQGAIGFVQLAAHFFAHRVIGLAHRQCDQAIVVPDHYVLSVGLRRVLQEVERQAMLGIVRAALQQQAQPQQAVEQPVLGGFDFGPELLVAGLVQVGNGAVVAAGGAKFFGRVGRHHPVTHPLLVILAEPVGDTLGGQRAPAPIRGGVQRRNLCDIR